MQVLVPTRLAFAKFLALTLSGLLLSFGAGAMEQDYPGKKNKKPKNDYDKTAQQAPPTTKKHQYDDGCQTQTPTQQTSDQNCGQTKAGHKHDQVSQTGQTGQSGKTGQTNQTGKTDQSGKTCNTGKADQTNQTGQTSQWSQHGHVSNCGATITANQCHQHTTQANCFLSQQCTNGRFSSWCATGEEFGYKWKTTDWSGTTWSDSHCDNVKIHNVNQRGAKFKNVWLGGKFSSWDLSASTITDSTFSGKFKDVDWENSLLENVIFDNAQFVKKNLKHSHFDGATLRNVQFLNSSLDSSVKFKDTHFDNVTFDCSTISDHTCFRGAYVLDRCGQWQALTEDHLTQMGAEIKTCKFFNPSAWFNDDQECDN